MEGVRKHSYCTAISLSFVNCNLNKQIGQRTNHNQSLFDFFFVDLHQDIANQIHWLQMRICVKKWSELGQDNIFNG